MDPASGTVAPEDKEVIQVSEAIWQRTERPGSRFGVAGGCGTRKYDLGW
jgi:hypothetical protein